jgi:two-component system sensor histidine kinase CiaH
VIQKLKRKFVAVMMTIASIFLLSIFVSMFLSTKANLERMSTNALHRALSKGVRTGAGAHENKNPPPPLDIPAGERTQISMDAERPFDGMSIILFHLDAGGDLSVLQNPVGSLDIDALSELAQRLEASPDEQGIVETYQLRYARRRFEDGSVRYALTDVSVERGILRVQVLHSLVIGLGASALFLLISVLLSRLMVNPVENAWERQRQFVADASHELKTPLTVLLSNAEMLAQSGALTDEKNLRRLDHIQAESLRMKGLVEDLLTLARSDSGRQTLNLAPVNWSYIVTLSALTLEPMIYDQGRALALSVEDELTVLGDPSRLRQLTDILLDNARKYGAPKTDIEIALSRSGKREILLRVTSCGTPIPDAELPLIFERFYRSDKSRGGEKGYGLGLSIARAIVQEHGGRIYAQSDGIARNSFFVCLPRASTQAAKS